MPHEAPKRTLTGSQLEPRSHRPGKVGLLCPLDERTMSAPGRGSRSFLKRSDDGLSYSGHGEAVRRSDDPTRPQQPQQSLTSDPAASECVAGVWEPATASRLRSRLLSLINAARAHRGHVWVAGFDEHRLHAFGERATALAAFGSMPRPGGLPLGWVPAAPPDPLWTGEDCSVCMETFSSP